MINTPQVISITEKPVAVGPTPRSLMKFSVIRYPGYHATRTTSPSMNRTEAEKRNAPAMEQGLRISPALPVIAPAEDCVRGSWGVSQGMGVISHHPVPGLFRHSMPLRPLRRLSSTGCLAWSGGGDSSS